MTDLPLHVVREDKNTITLGWEPTGDAGYRFSSSDNPGKFSHTWDPTRNSAKFSKADWYKVEALNLAAVGEYTGEEPPAGDFDLTSSISSGAVITAPTVWEITAKPPPAFVDFYVDGALLWTEQVSPYRFLGDDGKFDPANYDDGQHNLKAVARGDGTEGVWQGSVTTQKGTAPQPEPPPSGAPTWPYETKIGICDGADPNQEVFDLHNEMCARVGKKMPLRIDMYAMGGYSQKQFEEAMANGIEVLGIMNGTLGADEVNKDQVGNPPGWPNRYGPGWAFEVASYFKGKIKLWEICNEPDGEHQGWLPEPYAEFACGQAEEIRDADPAALISTGGIYRSTEGVSVPEFARAIVNEMKQRGRMDLFDYFAVHPYDPMDWNDPRNQWHMTFPYGDRDPGDTVREILDDAGLEHVVIYSSEYGNAPQNIDPEEKQASDLQGKFDIIEAGDLGAGIVFCLTQRGGQFPQFSITNADGSHRLAYDTTVEAAKVLLP